MFTGIVEAVGKIVALDSGRDSVRLSVSAAHIAEDVAIGDSVAVNGVCLTVVEIAAPQLTFEAVYETLRRTTLGQRRVGDPVNLERALQTNGRFGGHIVQGHIDGTGRIASIRPVGDSWFVYIEASQDLLRYIVTKGSVCVDGISLTVMDADDKAFSLSIIPHTWENTTLKDRHAGDSVNVETDIIGKYVEKLMGGWAPGGGRGVTLDLLARSGYIEPEPEASRRW
ncbi:riboflavin synthase [Armatimonas sp.]|uniref:riboflavin synthase n=1 Tax=Armatimonas sp. TaxID=1872638 RepID=UPI00374D3029